MKRALPRKLIAELCASVALAFVLTLGITFLLVSRVTDRHAHMLMQRQLFDIRAQIEEIIDRRLLMTAMQVRDRLPLLPDGTCASYRALAEEMGVDEINRVDADGVILGSTHVNFTGIDFHSYTGPAKEFLCLLDREIELVQPARPSINDGVETKYVGVWQPAGGFVQIGCTLPTVRRLTMTAITGLTHNIHVAGFGKVVITSVSGQIISDVSDSGREGAMFEAPDPDGFYCLTGSVAGFPVHVIVPRAAMTLERDNFTKLAAGIVLAALIVIAGLVAIIIARFVRAQVARQIAADMTMAASIQASSLPRVFPPYPALVGNFDVYAMMRPAREVGGDFYDFYHTGSDRLALVIADVSGKGIPAALFMMKAKTTLKAKLSGGGDLAADVAAVNAALSEGNDEGLFVTAWIGIVDLTTGIVRYVNAGHNPPYVKAADGTIRMVTDNPDLPLAAFGDYAYTAQEMRLDPGETLLLYTDGLTEARNRNGQLYGDDRLMSAFSQAPAGMEAACHALIAGVDAFAAGAPQADDMTLLAYRYLAPLGGPVSVRLAPTLESLAICKKIAAGAKFGPDASIVVDEIISNIVRCSGASEFVFAVTEQDELIFRDNGTPFDPTAQEAPDVSLGADDRAVGGLGIFLVRALARSVVYRREGEWNVLTVAM